MQLAQVYRRFTTKHTRGTGCWVWTGQRNQWGYGRLKVDGRTQYAHRTSWALHIGPIPDGLCVLHHCDTPACVRPGHLWVGTRQENQTDMRLKGRGTGTNLRPDARAWVREAVAGGLTQTDVAWLLGVGASTIQRITHERDS